MGFQTIEQVAAWAESNGGEDGLRESLAAGRFGADQRTLQLSNEWLRQQEEARRKERETRALEATAESAKAAARSADVAERSAFATERAVRWTKWAAIFSAIGIVINALVSIGTARHWF